MGEPRPDAADGVVAGLVTEQVHEHSELPHLSIASALMPSPSRAPSSTAALKPRRPASCRPRACPV